MRATVIAIVLLLIHSTAFGATEVSCSTLMGPRTMLAIVAGQSNAANFGQSPMNPPRDVYNFFDGRCFKAHDPLLGANGERGSVWTRLGKLLIERKTYDKVIFAPVAIGGTSMAQWAPGGQYHPMLLAALDALNQAGLRPTHILWHQGETDAIRHTSAAVYKDQFQAMLSAIRARGITAPVYVSVATYFDGATDEPLRQAQKSLADVTKGIYPGPDTDSLGPALRFDGVHFSDTGLQGFAWLWAAKLSK